MRRLVWITVAASAVLSIFLMAGCADTQDTESVPTAANVTADALTPTAVPTEEPTEAPPTPEPTPEIMVIDPVGDDWPAEFLQFPKYSGDGALISSEISEDRRVMTRTYSKMSEYSIANYQEQLRRQDFVSNDNADFLRGLDTVILVWSYTVNGSTGSVTLKWEIRPAEE